jgi:STE24 endopeptidase
VAEVLPSLDPQKQAAARRYARVQRRLMAVELVLGPAYLVTWLVAGWGLQVRVWATALAASLGQRFPLLLAGRPTLTLLVTAACIGLPGVALMLPLDFCSGYYVPRRFGISTQALRGWASDQVKSLTLTAVVGAPVLLGIYALLGRSPGMWWLWAAAGLSLLNLLLGVIAPVVLLPIFYRLTPLGPEHANLRERLMALAESAGTHVHGVFTLDLSRRTRAANAALTGLGSTRRILLGDTLLAEFSAEEIETVMGHELGHHVHGDIPFQLAGQAALTLVAFFAAHLALRWSIATFQFTGLSDPAALPAFALCLALVGLLALPPANALSRWREGLADEFALRLTHKPEAFAGAMTHLANQNLVEVDPERWEVWLLHSHPPIRDRLERARRFARRSAGLGSLPRGV